MSFLGRTPSNAPLTTADIPDGIIVAADLAPNSVDSSELVDGSIDTSHIGANQVTAAKVASDVATTAGTQTLTNKTLSTGTIATAVTGFTGIKVADIWRITSDTGYLAADSLLSSNWERADTDGQGDGTNALVGGSTKMTESSGIFSFPTEGVWEIRFLIMWYAQSGYNPQWLNTEIHSTTNNSAYDHIAIGTNAGTATQYLSSQAQCLFDVTDITTHKIKLIANPENNSALARGNSGMNETCAFFTRLGDT